jgi:PAS domain S-box-containing protein
MHRGPDSGHAPLAGGTSRKLVELRAEALEATADAVVITDQTGVVVWGNAAFEQLTGYSCEQIVGELHAF